MSNIRNYVKDIKWLGHASFKISGELTGGLTCYFDPWKLKSNAPADIIFISHDHYDHMSKEDIDKISTTETLIILPKMAEGKISGNLQYVSVGESFDIKGINVKVVPAYNENKDFHPKSYGGVGYLVQFPKASVYFAGDTDKVDEMDNLRPDIALLPVSGTYVMTAEEAAEVANKIKPKLAIPMHFGDIVGSIEDAKRFEKLCNVDVEILEI